MAFLIPVAPLIAAVGAGVSAIGAINQGEANANSAEYNAAVARQNAAIAQQQGAAASEAQKRDAARKMGAALANYGASGVQTDTGSPMDVLADSARMATLDNLTIKYNYALKAQGYQSQSLLDDSNASNSRTSSILNAGASVIKGAAAYTSMSGNAIPNFG